MNCASVILENPFLCFSLPDLICLDSLSWIFCCSATKVVDLFNSRSWNQTCIHIGLKTSHGNVSKGLDQRLSWHKRVLKKKSKRVTGFSPCSQEHRSSQPILGPYGCNRAPSSVLLNVCNTEIMLNILSFIYRCRDWGMHRGVRVSMKVSYKLAVSKVHLLPLFNSKSLKPELH